MGKILERAQALAFKYRAAVMASVALLILIFADPSPRSILESLPAVILGEGIRVWGLGYIGGASRDEEASTKVLVTAGPYSYTRNPLYWGNTLTGLGLTWGAFGNDPLSLRLIMLLIVALIYVLLYWILVIPHEERYLEEVFGSEYREYKRNVPKWWWKLKPYHLRKGDFNLDVVLKTEYWTILWITLIYVVLVAKVSPH